jgi:hypothetical protein
MPSEAQGAACKVVHTTCGFCGAFTEYDGTRALNIRQLRALYARCCPRCGERGNTIIAMVSYPAPVSYPLHELPANPFHRVAAGSLLPNVVDFRSLKSSGNMNV